MAGAADKQSIKLTKRDGLIMRWVQLVKEEDSRKVNFLVKQAIIAYITKGEFITIGKVHYDPKAQLAIDKPTTLYLWTKDCEFIQHWIESLKSKQFNISVTIREIIRRSIQVVPDNESEWIPSYYEFDDFRIPSLDELRITQPSHIHNPIPSTVSNNDTVPGHTEKEKSEATKPNLSSDPDVTKDNIEAPHSQKNNLTKNESINVLNALEPKTEPVRNSEAKKDSTVKAKGISLGLNSMQLISKH